MRGDLRGDLRGGALKIPLQAFLFEEGILFVEFFLLCRRFQRAFARLFDLVEADI